MSLQPETDRWMVEHNHENLVIQEYNSDFFQVFEAANIDFYSHNVYEDFTTFLVPK